MNHPVGDLNIQPRKQIALTTTYLTSGSMWPLEDHPAVAKSYATIIDGLMAYKVQFSPSPRNRATLGTIRVLTLRNNAFLPFPQWIHTLVCRYSGKLQATLARLNGQTVRGKRVEWQKGASTLYLSRFMGDWTLNTKRPHTPRSGFG